MPHQNIATPHLEKHCIRPSYTLEELMIKQKLSYFGHLCAKYKSLEKSTMLGVWLSEKEDEAYILT